MPNSSIVILIGHVGGDPLTSTTGKGTKVSKFSLAVSRKRNDKETTTWYRVTAFGRLAEQVEQWVRKGRALQVSGEIYANEYESKDGTKKMSVEVEADRVAFLDSSERPKDSDVAAEKVAVAAAGKADDSEPPF